jgi:hypothetical protein
MVVAMLAAIGLHRQHRRQAGEVEDIGIDGMLTPEAKPVQTVSSQ